MSAASAVNLKRVTLELGGKSALAIFNDADGKYNIHTNITNSKMNLSFTSVTLLRLYHYTDFNKIWHGHTLFLEEGKATFYHNSIAHMIQVKRKISFLEGNLYNRPK